MLAVVFLHCFFKSGERAVYRLIYRYVDFGRCSPDNNDSCAAVFLLERAYVLAQLFNHFPACGSVFHVVAVESFGIVLVEGSLHRNYLLKLFTHGVDVFLLEHLGIHCCLICVLGINVPCTEYDVVEVSKRNDVSVCEIFLVFAFSDAYFVILCH